MTHRKLILKTQALTRQLAVISTLVGGLATAAGCSGTPEDTTLPDGADPTLDGTLPPENGAVPGGAQATGGGGVGGSTIPPAGSGDGSTVPPAGSGDGSTVPPAESGDGSTVPLAGPGRVVMRRLSIVEYNETVYDLLQTSEQLSASFPADFTAFGFDNIATALTLTEIQFEYFFDAAKRISAEVLSSNLRSDVVPCDLATEGEACVTTALNALLPRAWRRPLEAGDVEPLVAVYAANKADGNTDDDSFARVLQAVLLSPEFLYRVERNSGVGEVRDLDGYEVASRLSYFLWSTMPDEELTAAAASGALNDTAGLTAQVTRMLASDKAAAFAENFGDQWLPVRALRDAQPSPEVYSDFDEELRSAMAAETRLFFADVAEGTRSLPELFTSSSGYVNDRLAQHYDMDPVGSDEPVFAELPANRAGLLTQGTFLTAVAYAEDSHPVRRGKWMLASLLCKEPPAPNFDIPDPPPRVEGATAKEQLASHQTEAICKSCHMLMDPLGLAFEQYDGIGAFRTEDRGAVIDPSGIFVGDDGEVPFDGPADLSQLIAAQPSVAGCVAEHVFAYALGRGPSSDFDYFILEEVGASFDASGQLFPTLVEALATSDVFRKREDEASAQ